jgi:hypothetical protein
MRPETAELKRALSKPAERAHVLEQVRAELWRRREDLGLLRKRMEALDEQLQSPPTYLYEDGSFEVVATAIGPDMGAAIDGLELLGGRKLEVRIVTEQGTSNRDAGEIVWSQYAHAK